MKTISIQIDIYSPTVGACYRLYINDILMTERLSWWDIEQSYVEELVIIEIEENSTVMIRIETVGKQNLECIIKRIRVDGVDSASIFQA